MAELGRENDQCRQGATLIARLSLQSPRTKELFGVIATIVAIQGGVILAQSGAALVVGPELFGQIRVLESAFAIALLIAGCGMPVVAMHNAAHGANRWYGRRLFAPAVAVSTAGSLVVVAATIASAYLIGCSGRESFLLMLAVLAGALIPACALRIGAAVVQGWRDGEKYAVRNVLLSLLMILVTIFLTWWQGVAGWVVGRYVMELGLAISFAGIVIGARRLRFAFRLRSSQFHWALTSVRLGFTANLSLFGRVAADGLPLLILQSMSMYPAEIGYWGMTTLMLFFPVLLTATYAQYKTPIMVSLAHDRAAVVVQKKALLRGLLVLACFGFFIFVAVAVIFIFVPVAGYRPAVPALLIAAVSLPFRAFMLANGVVSMVYQRYRYALALNVFEITVLCFAMLVWQVESAAGAAAAFLLSSVCVAALSALVPAELVALRK